MQEIVLKRGITLNFVIRYENVKTFMITNSLLVTDIVLKELNELLIEGEQLYLVHEAPTMHGIAFERAIIITRSAFPASIIDFRDTELYFGEEKHDGEQEKS